MEYWILLFIIYKLNLDHTETWYSKKIFPGTGLKILGHHISIYGNMRDYICFSIEDYSKGKIINTSFWSGNVNINIYY